MMLDLSKPVRFRDTYDWKILSIVQNPLGEDSAKLVVNVMGPDGDRDTLLHTADGKFCDDESESKLDLINTGSRYVNVNDDGPFDYFYETRHAADLNALVDRIAVLRIDLDTKTAHLEPI